MSEEIELGEAPIFRREGEEVYIENEWSEYVEITPEFLRHVLPGPVIRKGRTVTFNLGNGRAAYRLIKRRKDFLRGGLVTFLAKRIPLDGA